LFGGRSDGEPDWFFDPDECNRILPRARDPLIHARRSDWLRSILSITDAAMTTWLKYKFLAKNKYL
jgi:hypothetical protein